MFAGKKLKLRIVPKEMEQEWLFQEFGSVEDGGEFEKDKRKKVRIVKSAMYG